MRIFLESSVLQKLLKYHIKIVAISLASSVYSGGSMANGGSWKGLGGTYGNSGVGMIAFGTVSGGAGAALTGGNFWQGAVTGLVVSGLNHAMHGGFAKSINYTY